MDWGWVATVVLAGALVVLVGLNGAGRREARRRPGHRIEHLTTERLARQYAALLEGLDASARIDAIKRLRGHRPDLSLKAAKDVVDRIAADRQPINR